MFNIGNLIVELPLCLAFLFLGRKGLAALKADPFGPEEKKIAIAAAKALGYLLIAGILMWWLAPPLNVLGIIMGFLLTTIFAVLNAIAVIELWAFLDKVDDLAWRDGWTDPWNRKSGKPTPLVRWARRFALVAFGLFVLIVAGVTALSGGASSNQAGSSGTTPATSVPAVRPSATPSTTTPPQTTTTVPPTTTTRQPIDNSCDGPKQITVVDNPSNIPFSTKDLQICNSGKWQTWEQLAPGVTPPTTVQVKAWIVADDGKTGYGQVSDLATGDSYVIKTTSFH